MSTIKEKLFTNWHVMRILRLAIGVWMLVMAIQTRDWIVGVFSTFFLYQAVTDTGCCGTQACYTPIKRTKEQSPNNISDIEYEEIK